MPNASPDALLRSIPSVDRLLAEPALGLLEARYSREIIKRAVRQSLESLRDDIRSERADAHACTTDAVIARVSRFLDKRVGRRLRTVINATGVIVHTNIGRSPLSRQVAERIVEAACAYSNLEYDLEKGARGERNAHLRGLIEELTGAEGALAVNNNAAAVLLALSSLAHGREVIVSRGELIEIGGSFRIPDVMARSGAILKEVGTTNRTHPRDYLDAITENTGLILKVHPSNYRIEGFTREVELEELVLIGRSKGVPTMMDLGSGCLIDLKPYGLAGETTVLEVVEAGVHVVTFSGDKLLGGPQAGIIVGRAELIEKMRTNPLARALRMDKLTLAALEATLQEYTRPGGPAEGVPTIKMIMKTKEELQATAETLAEDIKAAVEDKANVSIVEGVGRVGGGALPLGDLPGPRVAVQPRDISAGILEQRLRAAAPPLIVLVKADAVLIDPRTLLEGQPQLIPNLIMAAIER